MLKTLQDVIRDIQAGRRLALAGDEALLAQLPAGDWIAGTTPYFMAPQGGVVCRDRLFATDLTEVAIQSTLRHYRVDELARIPADAPENGFSLIIIPATSPAHLAYAQKAPDFPGLFMKPIIGWISGVHLDDLGRVAPKVFSGNRAGGSDQEAVVMHCTLPGNRMASLDIINLFQPGDGPAITFETEGFSARTCKVDGVPTVLADWLRQSGADSKLPLVANYAGAMVNVSFQGVRSDGTVDFYAPVFRGVTYHLAAPVPDYIQAFDQTLPKDTRAAFSCNCILNFLYSSLEGKVTQGVAGPVTFGEIAYQLLNQTMAYLEILEH